MLASLLLAAALAAPQELPPADGPPASPAFAHDEIALARGLRVGRTGLRLHRLGAPLALVGFGVVIGGWAIDSQAVRVGGAVVAGAGLGGFAISEPLMAFGGYQAMRALGDPDRTAWKGATALGLCFVAMPILANATGARREAVSSREPDPIQMAVGGAQVVTWLAVDALARQQLDDALHLARPADPHATRGEERVLHRWTLIWAGDSLAVPAQW